MRTRTRLGHSDYTAPPVPVSHRQGWEFLAVLRGRVAATLAPGTANEESLRARTLWAVPTACAHGWTSDGAIERAVFDFNEVPRELEVLLPPRGYYRVPLSPADCQRLRHLAEAAIAMDDEPTELVALHDQGLLVELSMMALRNVTPRRLAAPQRARRKVEQARGWYERHMAEDPGVDQIAHAVSVSATHLRRLCHEVRNESPHHIFQRLRMRRVTELLQDQAMTTEEIASQVGFSSASALSRAVKTHFGESPRQLRSHLDDEDRDNDRDEDEERRRSGQGSRQGLKRREC